MSKEGAFVTLCSVEIHVRFLESMLSLWRYMQIPFVAVDTASVR